MSSPNARLSTPAPIPTTGSNDQPSRSVGKIIAVAIALIAAVHFALFGYFLFRTAITSPISDMFTYIADYLRFGAGEASWLDYLWQAHGEHHLVWIRLLTWADVEMFHTRGIPFMAAATAAITATAALIWWQLRRAEPRLGGTPYLSLLAPMLILSSANVTDCSVPINTTYPLTVFFLILALVLFAGGPVSHTNPPYRRVVGILAAFCASLATATGLLAWPILVWIAWRERLPAAWPAALAGLGLIYILFYAHNLNFLGLAPALDKDVASFLSPAHLGKLLDYFFAFLGLPLTRSPHLALIGRGMGAALFLAGLSAVIVATFTRRLSTPLDRIAIGMILLAFGAAALATVGRSDLIDEVKVPVRYTLFATSLHVGLLCLLLPRATRYFTSSRGHLLLCSAGLMFAVLLLIQQVAVGRSAVQIASAIAHEADCFAQGAHPGPVSEVVSRAPQGAQQVLTALRERGLLAPRASDCTHL
jgi:hypothetical protein